MFVISSTSCGSAEAQALGVRLARGEGLTAAHDLEHDLRIITQLVRGIEDVRHPVQWRELAVVEDYEPVLSRRDRLLCGIGWVGAHEHPLKLRCVEVEFVAEVLDVLVRIEEH